MLAPNWLFLYLGCALLAAGVLAVPMPLVIPSEMGGPLDLYGMLFGAAFVILGAQLVGFYLSAHAFCEATGLIEGGLCAHWQKYRALEACLATGFALAMAGLGVGVWSLFAWIADSGVETRLRLLVIAVMLIVLGTQTVFQGFLASLLANQHDSGAH